MDLPNLIRTTSPFPILRVLCGVFLSSFQVLIEHTKLKADSKKPDQTPHHAMSDLDLHCLSVSHKKDARLVWIEE